MTETQANNAQRILLVDDDTVFLGVMERAMVRRGLEVQAVTDSASAEEALQQQRFDYASVDLKLAEESGLQLIPGLLAIQPDLKIVMLTGYSSIATAVQAVKSGAFDYLPKPANADELLNTLRGEELTSGKGTEPLADTRLSVNRLEWEHIQKVLADHDGNVSATARALGMHRRTLQRKLNKRPVQQ